MNKNRLDYIDALRGIAIAGVFVVHTASIPDIISPLLRAITNSGQYGVQLFFCVSAFTILLSLDRRRSSDGHIYSNFFIRRLFRIVPVYWFGILIYTAIYGMGSRTLLPGPELWHYPMHAALLNVLHPSTLSSVVPGGWSISLEVLFYMTVPFLFCHINNLKRAVVFSCVTVVFFPALNLIFSKLIGPYIMVDDAVLNRLFWYRFPLNQVGAFSMGFLLFFLSKNTTCQSFLSDRKLNALLLFSSIAVCVFLSVSKILLPPKHLLYSCLFCLIGLLLSNCQWRIIVNMPFRFLGKISYSCYLVHFLVLNMLYKFQEPLGLGFENEILRYFAYLFLTFALTMPIAWFMYKTIECPSIKLGSWVSRKVVKK